MAAALAAGAFLQFCCSYCCCSRCCRLLLLLLLLLLLILLPLLLLLLLVFPVVLDSHRSACQGKQWRHACILIIQIQDQAGSILHRDKVPRAAFQELSSRAAFQELSSLRTGLSLMNHF